MVMEPVIAISCTIAAIMACQIMTWGYVKLKNLIKRRYQQWRERRKDKNKRKGECCMLPPTHEDAYSATDFPSLAGCGAHGEHIVLTPLASTLSLSLTSSYSRSE